MGFDKLPDGKYYGRKFANGAQKGSLLCYFTEGQVEPKTRKEAQVAFENFCGAVRTGKAWLPEHPDAGMTIDQFVGYYERTFWAEEERTGNGDTPIFNAVKTHFHGKPLVLFESPITFTLFARWLASEPIKVRKRVKGHKDLVWVSTGKKRSKKTLGEYAKRVRHMVYIAKRDQLIKENPFTDDNRLMGKTVKSKGRKRGVTEQELAALYTACATIPKDTDPSNIACVTTARRLMKERLDFTVELGPRRKEMQLLQMENIDFEEWTLTFEAEKVIEINGVKTRVRGNKKAETRIAPIPAVLRPLFLRKRQEFGLKREAFVFGIDGKHTTEFDSAWAAIKKDAHLDDATLIARKKMVLQWRDLRGEAGTRMRRRGADQATIAKVLGNSKEVFNEHYEGETLDLMRKAVG